MWTGLFRAAAGVRLGQLEPKALITADGYRFGGCAKAAAVPVRDTISLRFAPSALAGRRSLRSRHCGCPRT
ncbi:hypothetical protein EF834_13780 [Rhodococcus spongiicola]|uniref:Uncharacterized protein n=1 Tax=Rhodococcus spongiicola TaxID=2487352 RepID=A0A3S3DZ05_9NOCA|nr:hypothetical protein EF834_13780 [Rhodococcus spongiicola]